MSLRGLETAITRSITFSGYRSSHLSPIKGCIGSEIIDEVGYLPITREFRPGYRPIPKYRLDDDHRMTKHVITSIGQINNVLFNI